MSEEDWTKATDPWVLFDAWYADAARTEVDVPNAMQLATVDPDGQPSIRTVLLKGVSPAGLRFFTNLESRKGQALASHPRAAVAFHWKSIKRQVIARGAIEPLPGNEADEYWATRPRGSQIAAWASAQSRPIPVPGAYDQAVAEVEGRFTDQPVPRPPFWSGFRLVPHAIEFWLDGASRMHTRIEFTRTDASAVWDRTQLYP